MRPRHLAALAVAALTLLSGCSLGDEPPAALAAPGAKSGGVLTVAIGRPGSIDPTNAYEPNGRLVVSTMCDTLLQQDPSTGELRGALAETFQTAETGSRFIVRLRDDLRFSNGTKVTADDVKVTLSRLASRDFASFRQDLMVLVGGFQTVSGAVETDNAEWRERLGGIRIIDARSLEIALWGTTSGSTTRLRMADYLRVLTDAATSPVPRALVEGDPESLEKDPVCVGPYRLAAPWDGVAKQIRLVRNPHYRGHNPTLTGGGRGYADEIVFRVYDTPAARLAAWRKGEVQVAPLELSQAQQLRTTSPDAVQVGTGPSVQFVGTPTTGRYADPRVRAALSLALDRTALSSSAFAGLAEPATGFLSPALGEGLFQKDACDLTEATLPEWAERKTAATGIAVTPAAANPAGARALLSKAGLSLAGQPLDLRYNDEGRNPALARAVADMWRTHLGLRVRLVPMPWKDYLAMATSPAGFDSAFLESWAPNYPGPDQYVAPLFTGGGVGKDNWNHWNDPSYDTGLARYTRAVEEPEDLAVSYRGVERFLCSQVPLIPVLFGKHATAVDTTTLATAREGWLHHSTGTVLLREVYRKAQ